MCNTDGNLDRYAGSNCNRDVNIDGCCDGNSDSNRNRNTELRNNGQLHGACGCDNRQRTGWNKLHDTSERSGNGVRPELPV